MSIYVYITHHSHMYLLFFLRFAKPSTSIRSGCCLSLKICMPQSLFDCLYVCVLEYYNNYLQQPSLHDQAPSSVCQQTSYCCSLKKPICRLSATFTFQLGSRPSFMTSSLDLLEKVRVVESWLPVTSLAPGLFLPPRLPFCGCGPRFGAELVSDYTNYDTDVLPT